MKLRLDDLTPPETVPAYHGASQSEYLLPLEPGFAVRLRPREIDPAAVEFVHGADGVRVPVLSTPDLLITLDEPEIALGVEPVSAWLRHLVIRTPELGRAVAAWPRPQVLQRLADLADALGNSPLAKQLDGAARRVSPRVATPARTGVGTRIQVPADALSAPRAASSPWRDEQAMRLSRQRATADSILQKELAAFTPLPLRTLIAQAVEAKSYDAYHSTTMEGYRISAEVVEAIVRGEPLPDGPQDEESLRAAMAVKGYSITFDHVIELAKSTTPISAASILDLHEDLFRPSVDAGIVPEGALRGWRTGPVALRGWRHVPPNAAKIRDLIAGLEGVAADRAIHAVVKGPIIHLEFVTIHPFMDGNGRLGRLLMNLIFLRGGSPWVTVPVDERTPFFKSIETAQVDGDARPFVRFLAQHVREATKDLAAKARRHPARRRVVNSSKPTR